MKSLTALRVLYLFVLFPLVLCKYDPQSSSIPELSFGFTRITTSSGSGGGASGPIAASINQMNFSAGATYDFQSVLNGFKSPSASITITNSSGGDIQIPASNFLSLTGANATDFVVVGAPTGTIANGSNVNASIYYNSVSPGIKTATLTIQPGGNISPVSVSLQATGVANYSGNSLTMQFESMSFIDISGNGNGGIVTGNFGGTIVPGVVGNAIRLGYGPFPTFDYIDIPDSAGSNFHFAGNQSFSVTAWISPDTASVGTIFDKSENNGPFSNLIFDFHASNGSVGVMSWREGDFSEGFSWVGPIIGWHHVACVYNPSLGNPNTTLYLDGVAVQSGYLFSSTFATANSYPANIGRFRRDASQLYVGLIDELRIYYPVALTAAQIQTIYNSR